MRLRRIPLRQWRSRIAAGFQDFARFELLARQTVGVGDLPEVDSDAAVLAALGRADAGAVLERLDHGLDTQLGLSADGTELSGGQWQKLALGRAMMRTDPLLLLLDEPTSALDAQAEHQLFERYARNARELAARTGATLRWLGVDDDGRIRVDVVTYADRVVIEVLDSGRGFDGIHLGSDDVYAPDGRGIMFMRALMDRGLALDERNGGEKGDRHAGEDTRPDRDPRAEAPGAATGAARGATRNRARSSMRVSLRRLCRTG